MIAMISRFRIDLKIKIVFTTILEIISNSEHEFKGVIRTTPIFGRS